MTETLILDYVLEKEEVNVKRVSIQRFINQDGIVDTNVSCTEPTNYYYTCRMSDAEREGVENTCLKKVIILNDGYDSFNAWISRMSWKYDRVLAKKEIGFEKISEELLFEEGFERFLSYKEWIVTLTVLIIPP